MRSNKAVPLTGLNKKSRAQALSMSFGTPEPVVGKQLRSLLVMLLVALWLVYSARAVSGYGPFAPTERIRSVVLNEYPRSSTDAKDVDSFVVAMYGSSRAILSLKRGVADASIQLGLPNGETQTWDLVSSVSPYISQVYSACLNEDVHPDFLVTFSNTGCGLAAERTDILFLLSTKSGYRALLTESWNFATGTLVDLKGNHQVAWVQTLRIEADTGDNRSHTFWVHRLLAFQQDRLDAVDSFAPRWRRYTFQPNHAESDLLTMTKKDALLRAAVAKVPLHYLKEIASKSPESAAKSEAHGQ
jgi:hypothetical protein